MTIPGDRYRMCQKRSSVNFLLHDGKIIRVDPCIRHLIHSLNAHGYNTVGCCCGHKRYPLTIICKTKSGRFYDLVSGVDIPRTRNFYKMDEDGYFYIPEIVNY